MSSVIIVFIMGFSLILFDSCKYSEFFKIALVVELFLRLRFFSTFTYEFEMTTSVFLFSSKVIYLTIVSIS
jgi:hypothetical protein